MPELQLSLMKQFLIILFLIFPTFITNAQTVQVLNAKTGNPVEGVLIISGDHTMQTDEAGKAKIDVFGNDESLLFQHSSFLKFTSTKQKIASRGNTVLLIEDPVRLNEVVVSVNRWEQSKAEISNKIKTISSEEILHYNPQTAADLVGIDEGVFVQKSQMGGGSPMIRGFSANRVLIVVDGIRMNNAIYRSGNLQNVISLDANSIENTEIIFGPGSVIYGSDALGGVMSFNTLKPRLSTNDKIVESGKLFSRYSSANFEKTIHGTFNIGSKKWAALVSSTYTDYDDLQMGKHGFDEYLRPEYVLQNGFDGTDKIIQNKNPKVQRYTAYNQFNILGKVRFRPNENVEVNFSANHSQTSDIPRYDRLIVYRNGKLRYGDWHYGPQIWTLFSGELQLKKDYSLFDKMNLLTGYQLYTESRNDRNLNDEIRNGRQEDISVFSVNLDFGKTIDAKNELFYGFETYINKINSSGTTTNLLTGEKEFIPSRYPDDSNYGNFAGYLSYKLNLRQKIILEAGARFTHTWLNGKFNPDYYNFPFNGFDMKNSAVNGSIGMTWHPAQKWQINVHASTGFRSPNIDDASKIFDSEPGNVVVPNPDLKPEYAQNFEVGIIRSFAGRASVELTCFFTHLKDAMVRRDFILNGQDSIIYDGTLSKVEALVNADAANIYGASFAFEFLLTNSLRTRHYLTYTDGADSDGLPIRHAPPTFGTSHLIYEIPGIFMDIYASYSGQYNYEELAPSEQDKPYMYATDKNGHPYSPSWWTLNLKFNYKLSRNVVAGGGLENILNKRYRTYSSGIVSSGINAILSLNVRF